MRHDFETGLSSQESRDLSRLAGIMVPPDAELDIPGADNPVIFADIEKSLGRDRAHVKAALAELSALTGAALAGATLAGAAFADLDETQAEALAHRFLARPSAAATVLGRVILQCYYRDDRVIRSLGLEPRPPFPKGHTLEQGDWSLLDPVRARPKMWRDAP